MPETRQEQRKRNVGNLKLGKLTPLQKELVDNFAALSRERGRVLGQDSIRELGFKHQKLQGYFGNFELFLETVLRQHPDLEEIYIEKKIRESSNDFIKQTKGYKRFVITSAVSDSGIHHGFYDAIKTYCKVNKAKLIVIPCGKIADAMPPELASELWAFNKHYLNSNIYISDIKPQPKAINPLLGLGRLGQRNGSIIIGSPKQFLEFVAVGDNKMPHALMSTGAITVSNYSSAKGEKRKVDIMAAHDHVVGGIIVEIVDNKFYHFRQIQAEGCGAFVDLGKRYSGNGVTKMAPAAFYIGDYHVGETDPMAAKVWDEVQKVTGVTTRIHGDFFSGISINHHEEHNQIRRAQLMKEGRLDLQSEIEAVAQYIDNETAKCKKVVILASNHHDFLSNHYIPRGVYQKDPQNLEFASQLIAPMIEGCDPLRYAVENLIGLRNPERVVWLGRDESFKVAEIELGAHGDKGASGSKGSANTLEKAYGNCVVGHSHTPKIIRGFWQVGTSTYLKLPYTIGASSWVQSSCLIYPNGSRQLINCINGKWRLP